MNKRPSDEADPAPKRSRTSVVILGREYDINTKGLDLSDNGLTELPADVRHLTALADLNLGDNRLTELPADVRCLTALTHLNLGGNRLTALLADVWHLRALTHLDLQFNQLTALPAELGHLAALTYLGLHNNRLTTLPAELGRLTALTRLRIENNPEIKTMPLCVARRLSGFAATVLLHEQRALAAAFPASRDPLLFSSAALAPDVQRLIYDLVTAQPWRD